jgi:type IV pilus assembly protein PilN
MNQYSADLEKAKQRIASTYKISSEILDTVEKALPTSVTLQYLELIDYNFTLEGDTPVWTSVAELAHNLDKTGLFTRVHVNYINQNKDAATYKFDILCELKEVAVK